MVSGVLFYQGVRTGIERGDLIVLYEAVPAISIIRGSENLLWSRTGELDDLTVDDKVMIPGVVNRADFAMFCQFLAAILQFEITEMFKQARADRNIFMYRFQ